LEYFINYSIVIFYLIENKEEMRGHKLMEWIKEL